MKKPIYFFLLAICGLLSPALLSAQTDDHLTNATAQERYEHIKAMRTAYLTQRMNLSPEQAGNFWALYNVYEQERQQLQEQSRRLRKNRSNSTNIQADLEQILQLKQQELALEKDYMYRFANVISWEQVAVLYEAEHSFRKMLMERMRHHSKQGDPDDE
jgi:hypothetical protein